MPTKTRYAYDTEEWRDILGIPGYEVSSFGAVRSVERVVDCADGRRRRFKGREVKSFPDKRVGYYRLTLYVQGRGISRTVHSLVAEAFSGKRPWGMEVRHLNGNSADNRSSNLEYCTSAVNNADLVRHGTHANAAKDFCLRSHRLIRPNLTNKKNARECMACARARAYLQGHPEADMQSVSDDYYSRVMAVA